MDTAEKIKQGKTYLGIELGSTRIKAVLIDDTFAPVAGGSHDWENRLENGYWTYSLEDIHCGIQKCYASLSADVLEKYSVTLETVGAMGISAMMHGYMAFNDSELLAPFRTWRNTTTEKAATELTSLLSFNIPQRWSIAHLYQAILDKEPHVEKITHITTLAGYIHYLLTGKRVVGIGEGSGIFPISVGNYNKSMLEKTEQLFSSKGFEKPLNDVLPQVLTAGESGGILTESGARFLDPTGKLKAGIPLCPPEGDAGTGMAATNAVLPKTGNVSAGTSIFAMLVLDKLPANYYTEIDMVTTPCGSPVAMVHCNNCCTELDMWVKMFGEFAALSGKPMDKSELYEMLYKNALNGAADCGGFTAYNFLSGEPVVKVESGRPMYFRTPDGKGGLAEFFRAELYSSMAALKNGMDILFETENAAANQFTGHGGLFKVKDVAQQFLADGLNTPVSVMKTAGEGGAWGMALLAGYMVHKGEKSLAEWLDSQVFGSIEKHTLMPNKNGTEGFNKFMERYNAGLNAEKAFEVK